MEKGFMYGLMVDNMKEIGIKTRWKVMVSLVGLMGVNTQESIKMMKKKVLGYFNGRLGGNMKESGLMVFLMAKA